MIPWNVGAHLNECVVPSNSPKRQCPYHLFDALHQSMVTFALTPLTHCVRCISVNSSAMSVLKYQIYLPVPLKWQDVHRLNEIAHNSPFPCCVFVMDLAANRYMHVRGCDVICSGAAHRVAELWRPAHAQWSAAVSVVRAAWKHVPWGK